jgi:hypothetical protein
MRVLYSHSVRLDPALAQRAVLYRPVVFDKSASSPIAIFPFERLLARAAHPIAIL